MDEPAFARSSAPSLWAGLSQRRKLIVVLVFTACTSLLVAANFVLTAILTERFIYTPLLRERYSFEGFLWGIFWLGKHAEVCGAFVFLVHLLAFVVLLKREALTMDKILLLSWLFLASSVAIQTALHIGLWILLWR